MQAWQDGVAPHAGAKPTGMYSRRPLGRIANAAGLLKELKDPQGGAGFSFADLAADHTGKRIAEIALNLAQHRPCNN
jgi:hypothetical protein